MPGYQLKASALQWVTGDGTRSFHDPIRVPQEMEEGGRTNPFFVAFSQTLAVQAVGLGSPPARFVKARRSTCQ